MTHLYDIAEIRAVRRDAFIDGLIQERPAHWSYVFLILTHRYATPVQPDLHPWQINLYAVYDNVFLALAMYRKCF